ncbi:PHD finger protein 20-like isoform X14 [Scylla paramamosain]|uniref:PHD finger protein 20-like isoform X14 n=1 Tax=Scylla paramamosain TaxID=85552 RepID=UPI003082A9C6
MFTAPIKNEKSEAGKGGETKEDKSSDEEEDFLGFSPSTDKVLSGLQVTSKSDIMVSRADILQASAMARQLHVYKPGIDFVPGARLEVLESRDNNWYQCKIVEVDWGELDILVHYERWSNRFDEWLKMDSTRIRSLSRTSQRREKRNSAYSVGDRVLARWSADGKRYQARVTKELGDDQFEVLFFDGVAKVLRSTALAKVDSKVGEIEEQRGTPSKQPVTDDEDSLLSPGATSASSTDSRSSSPEPGQSSAVSSRVEELMEVETVTPVRKNIFDVEIIEQKRKSKRKAAVEELFQSLKKRRKYEHQSQGKVPTSSPRHQQQQLMQQEQQKPQQQQKQHQQQQQQIRSTQSRKTSFSKKKGREAATESQEEIAPHQAEATTSEAPDSPVLSPRIVSIDMSDGWKKCCSQRTHGTTAGKWDTFYLAPDGKKIRSKNDLYRYCEEFKVTCDIEKFDFSVKNMREVIDGQTDARSNVKANEEQKESEKDPSTSEVKEPEVKFPVQELCGITKTATGKKPDMKKSEIRQTDVSKHSESPRMKLEIPIIPKTEHIVAPNEFVVCTEHNDHQCPKDGCGKSFRKENLLQMHIKHYHPELLKKTSNWAPNVADLAYARTVGDHLDTSSSPTHASPPVDKMGKSETGSKKAPRGLSSVSSPDARGKVVDKKTSGSIKTIIGSKDSKKRDKSKLDSEQGPPISEDEIESKEEVEDLAEDIEVESPISTLGLQSEDPDYVPSEGEVLLMRKDRKEKRKTRGESKGKKKKIVASESVCEDDQQETKTVTKYRYCKHKGFTSSKASVSSTNAEVPLPEPSSASPSKKTPGPEAEAPSIEAEEDTGDAWAEGTEGVPTSETSAEIINCGCGSTEEEGLMLQCDVCLCWQHGDCYNIVGEDQVPDKYICSLCDHPRLERSSHKFRHHQDWLKEGRLPRFSFSSSRGDLRLEACVRRGHELTAQCSATVTDSSLSQTEVAYCQGSRSSKVCHVAQEME